MSYGLLDYLPDVIILGLQHLHEALGLGVAGRTLAMSPFLKFDQHTAGRWGTKP